MLRKDIFQKICKLFGSPEIDLFASRLNHQLERYVSWQPDPKAEYVDSFTENWGCDYFCAIPPFCTVNRVVQKCIHDKAEGILIIPEWPSQPWYNLVHRMAGAPPFEIAVTNNELLLPFSSNTICHPLSQRRKSLKLRALQVRPTLLKTLKVQQKTYNARIIRTNGDITS